MKGTAQDVNLGFENHSEVAWQRGPNFDFAVPAAWHAKQLWVSAGGGITRWATIALKVLGRG